MTHCLRKAASRRLAEAGCSANAIAAITGHATLAEISGYTKATEQRSLAPAAINRQSTGRRDTEIPNLTFEFEIPPEKTNIINIEDAAWRPVGESNPCFQRERLTS